MKGSFIFPRVSRFLSDQIEGEEYARWTEEDLLDAWIWALQFIAAARPISFVKKFDLKLSPGGFQELPEECVGVTDSLNNARKTTRRSTRLVDPSRGCPPVGPYRVREYSYEHSFPNNIYVYPEVPDDGKTYTFPIIGTYTPLPQSKDEDVVFNPSLYGPLFNLMIYYIGTGETESLALKSIAESHLNAALQSLKLDRDDLMVKERTYERARREATQ